MALVIVLSWKCDKTPSVGSRGLVQFHGPSWKDSHMTATTKNRRAPNTLGTVEQLPSGRYRAYYRDGGRRVSAPRTFPAREAANVWLANERADRAAGTWRDPAAPVATLGDYATDWLASRHDLAASTARRYADYLARYIGSSHLGV